MNVDSTAQTAAGGAGPSFATPPLHPTAGTSSSLGAENVAVEQKGSQTTELDEVKADIVKLKMQIETLEKEPNYLKNPIFLALNQQLAALREKENRRKLFFFGFFVAHGGFFRVFH